jgi:hypothetical protein
MAENEPSVSNEGNDMSLEILRQLAPPPKPVSYTIKKGDTLDSIAKAHGMTWEELNERNPAYLDEIVEEPTRALTDPHRDNRKCRN